MTGNKDIFTILDNSLQSEVKIGDDKWVQVKRKYDILVQTKKGVKWIIDVFYVPSLKHELLSVGQILQKGHDVIFKDYMCEIEGRYGVLIAKIKMIPNKILTSIFHMAEALFSACLMVFPMFFSLKSGTPLSRL